MRQRQPGHGPVPQHLRSIINPFHAVSRYLKCMLYCVVLFPWHLINHAIENPHG